MSRPKDPYFYPPSWHKVISAMEMHPRTIEMRSKNLIDLRHQFYSFRTAWRWESERLEKRGCYHEAQAAKAKYELMGKYSASIQGELVILKHITENNFEFQIGELVSGEEFESVANRDLQAEFNRLMVEEGKPSMRTQDSQRDENSLKGFPINLNPTKEQSTNHHRVQLTNNLKMGFWAPADVCYFTKAQFIEITGKEPPEIFDSIWGLGTFGEECVDPVINEVTREWMEMKARERGDL